ncbi:NrsF family protein, partial [Paraburkholderia sp. BR10879]
MKTRELVTRLASDVSPIERNAGPRRLTRALLHGLAGSAALLVALYGVRSDMPELILTTMFWVRL